MIILPGFMLRLTSRHQLQTRSELTPAYSTEVIKPHLVGNQSSYLSTSRQAVTLRVLSMLFIPLSVSQLTVALPSIEMQEVLSIVTHSQGSCKTWIYSYLPWMLCHWPSQKQCGVGGVQAAQISPLPLFTLNRMVPSTICRSKQSTFFDCTDSNNPDRSRGLISNLMSISNPTLNPSAINSTQSYV